MNASPSHCSGFSRTGLILGFLLAIFLAVFPASPRAAEELRLWDLNHSRATTLSEILPVLSSVDLLIVGEAHGNPRHHAAQLTIINEMHASRTTIAVGLEMFQQREQQVLDDWVAGAIPESEMNRAFTRNWGNLWPAYQDIFIYCRDHGIPMVGLNVPREITRKVARQGFASLTREELGLLPPIVCRIDPEYEAFLRRFVGTDGHAGAFERFCEAQLVWDAAFAVHALDYLKNQPDHTMIVLTGSVHAWKPAMPFQVHRLAPQIRQASIVPDIPAHMDRLDITANDADFLMLGL
ncbi:ChaN family lipoprotein [Desulfonatronum thioautotrophicum]|uniref:ChaN family lipoprotein n=1 Tax=Desulfonatronum thioautotrophicum TaxID=617001 RepID=UPI000A00864F|nr:ChaN family lipoprotein [Desulfonatronum thioautotrophicum]